VSFRNTHIGIQLGRRSRQLRDLWDAEGLGGITDRVRKAAVDWLAPAESVLPVRREDVLAADLTRPFQPTIPSVISGQPLTINWVTTPASAGSGGHTTLFRIIRYLEAHGYRNRVYFYDVYRGDFEYYKSIVRNYYDFHGIVAKVDDGMEDAHIVMATGWPTAYSVFNARCAGKRFYFIQDYEPHFYPVGTTSLLAESTYRMGFNGITIGQCFAERLRADFGMKVDSFKYGCDTNRYHRVEGSRRAGVVFYARRESARRGAELGLMALEAFAARQPEVEIHIFGDKIGKLPFAFVDHGRLTPKEINEIYNRCHAGLSLSFTNVSLVALEMLAAGCIPVVNDAALIHADIDNPYVNYASPNPIALAAGLEKVVLTSDFDSLSRKAAASVHSGTWDDAGAAVDAILRGSLGLVPHNDLPTDDIRSTVRSLSAVTTS
jgi:O-antigen biosynthesis protein